MRARDAGLFAETGMTGPLNAITDVAGVRVGHTTLIAGSGRRRVGTGPVRTGVTIVLPHDGPIWERPVAAGFHRLNGNGEVTGTHWIAETGLLATPIGLTNTHSVGMVHDALVQHEMRSRPADAAWWSLPVVAETWDGVLNDINGRHVQAEHVWQALDTASDGPVAEGSVGSGTGMISFGFKGGIGSASRVVTAGGTRFTVGVLVQANHGERSRLRLDGIRFGKLIGPDDVPLPGGPAPVPSGAGSIIAVVATDAPLLPHQCTALAARASLGIGCGGGVGEIWSGDFALAFATGNRQLPAPTFGGAGSGLVRLEAVDPDLLSAVYAAAVDATEEAAANALFSATTMTGCDGVVAHALPAERVANVVERLKVASR